MANLERSQRLREVVKGLVGPTKPGFLGDLAQGARQGLRRLLNPQTEATLAGAGGPDVSLNTTIMLSRRDNNTGGASDGGSDDEAAYERRQAELRDEIARKQAEARLDFEDNLRNQVDGSAGNVQ